MSINVKAFFKQTDNSIRLKSEFIYGYSRYSHANFLTNCQQLNSQSAVVSFEYVDLAKDPKNSFFIDK